MPFCSWHKQWIYNHIFVLMKITFWHSEQITQTQGILPKKKKEWEFQDEIRKNSKMWVQGEVNLYKPTMGGRCKLKPKCCMDKPWVTHIHKTLHNPELGGVTALFIIIYSMISKVQTTSKWKKFTRLLKRNLENYQFCSQVVSAPTL